MFGNVLSLARINQSIVDDQPAHSTPWPQLMLHPMFHFFRWQMGCSPSDSCHPFLFSLEFSEDERREEKNTIDLIRFGVFYPATGAAARAAGREQSCDCLFVFQIPELLALRQRVSPCPLHVSIGDRLIGQRHEIVADGVEPEISHDCPIELKQHDGYQILLRVRIPGCAKGSWPEKGTGTRP